jgi:hypothetical protein
MTYASTGMNVSITDSSSQGGLLCSGACGGFVGLSVGNVTLSNLERSGSIGDIQYDLPPENFALDDFLTTLALLGPVSGGLVGASLPISFTSDLADLVISNATVDGSVAEQLHPVLLVSTCLH